MSANKKNKRQQSEDAPVEEADTTNYPGASKEVLQFIVRFVNVIEILMFCFLQTRRKKEKTKKEKSTFSMNLISQLLF
jgi:hypothetical protein